MTEDSWNGLGERLQIRLRGTVASMLPCAANLKWTVSLTGMARGWGKAEGEPFSDNCQTVSGWMAGAGVGARGATTTAGVGEGVREPSKSGQSCSRRSVRSQAESGKDAEHRKSRKMSNSMETRWHIA